MSIGAPTAPSKSAVFLAPEPTGDATGVSDSARVNATIDEAAAAGGGVVQLHRGHYFGNFVLKPRVILAGVGWSTVLRAPAAVASSVVSLGDDAYQFGVRDLRIDGSGSLPGSYGLRLISYGDALMRTSDDPPGYFGDTSDPSPALSNILVTDIDVGCYLGVNMREAKVIGCTFFHCGTYGLHLNATDCFVSACSSGLAGLAGFYVTGASNLLQQCKGWWAGWPASGTGVGFLVGPNAPATQLVGCEAQDNGSRGYWLNGCQGAMMRACKAGGDVGSALLIDNGATRCSIDLHNVRADRGFSGGMAVIDGATTTANDFRFSYDSAPATLHVIGFANGGGPGNSYTWGGADSITALGNVATTFTPNPRVSKTTTVTLTGNVTVGAVATGNALPGAELVIAVTQDATGGRTLTWNAQYALGGLRLNKRPNGRTVFRFVNVSATTAPSWQLVAVTGAPGELDYKEIVATAQTALNATGVEVGLDVVITVAAGDPPIELVFDGYLSHEIGGNYAVLLIQEGSDVVQERAAKPVGNGDVVPVVARRRLTPTPGTHTYKVILAGGTAVSRAKISAAAYCPASFTARWA